MKKPLFIYLTGCLFTLTLLLAACGGTPSNQTTTTTTQTTNNQTTATTTDNTPQATPSPTQSGNTSFSPYTGNGYTINYRPAWKAESDGNNGVTFTDPTQKGTALHMIVQTQSPVAALQIEEGTSLKDRCKPSRHVSTTITINGVTWDQAEYRCSSAIAGGSDQEIRTLEMQKPVGNTYYAIAYYATPQNFDNAVNGAFQIMTESFKAK
jgi:hypothetical protein